MTVEERLLVLRDWAEKNVKEYMFPFWTSDYIRDPENGGYYGTVTFDMERKNDIDRSLVLYGRMVYAFSSAYVVFGDEKYLESAKYTFDYLVDKFYDPEFGGAYSSVTTEGKPANTDKGVYTESFFVMACAAYYNACKDPLAYKLGMEAFRAIETCKTGPGQYLANITRDWKEQTEVKGRFRFPSDAIIFPHHLCQAYEQLYRATGEPEVLAALKDLASFLLGPAFDEENLCFTTFVDKQGKRIGDHQSLGHDCEISYLAMDVAELTADGDTVEDMKKTCATVLNRVLEIGVDPYGAVCDGYDVGTMEMSKSHVWWASAEAANAMIFAYWLTRDEKFLTACEKEVEYIDKYFINREHGDWYNDLYVDEEGVHIVTGMHGLDKLNGGKCPFHNSHMSFDIIRRVNDILTGK